MLRFRLVNPSHRRRIYKGGGAQRRKRRRAGRAAPSGTNTSPRCRSEGIGLAYIPSRTNKHVFIVAPAAPFRGCLHACSWPCLFVLSRYKGPKIFFACGAPRIPLEISKETVFSLQCFSFGPGAVLGGAYMLVRGHACSYKRVLLWRVCVVLRSRA